MKRRLLALLTVTLFVMPLFPMALSANAEGAVIELNVINCFPEAATDTAAIAFFKVLDGFYQQNPDIKLNIEANDPSSYPFKMQTLAMSDALPDLFLLEGASTQSFSDQGVIKPINDALDADPDWKNQFLPGVFGDISLGSDIYAIPFQMTPCTLLFYNEKLLDEVGIPEPPKDWPAFMDAVKVLKDAGKIPIAMGNKEQWVAVSPMFSTLADRVTGLDFTDDVKAGKVKFTDPDFIAALEKVAELRDAGAFNADINTLDSEQGRALFAAGDSGFMFEGGWAIPSIDVAVSEDLAPYIKVMDTPVIPDGKGLPMSLAGGSGFGWAYNYKLDDAKREAALRFIKYFTTGEYVKYLYEVGGAPAAVVTGADDSKLTPLTQNANAYVAQCNFLPVYDVVFPAEVYTEFYVGIQEILTGTSTPEQVAQSAQDALDRLLDF